MEAYHAYRKGERYWFDETEITMINQTNEQYMCPCPEEDLLLKYFIPVDETNSNACNVIKLTNSDLVTELKRRNPGVPVKPKILGSILKNYSCIRKSVTSGGKKYPLKIKDEFINEFAAFL